MNLNKLKTIQANLIAPKNQVNKFGGYKYRSCEDILTAVKPLLDDVWAVLTIEDDIVMQWDRFYVKATCVLKDSETGEELARTTALAREALDKKWMDVSQITWAASSYARKYALNGMFCIDDTKDADATNKGETYSSLKQKIEDCKDKAAFIDLAWLIKASASDISTAEYDELKKMYNEKNKSFS